MVRKEVWIAAIVEAAMKHCVMQSPELREAYKMGAELAAKIALDNRPKGKVI